MNEIFRMIFSVVAAAVVFLALFLLLHWHLAVCILICIGVYFGLFMILKPSIKIFTEYKRSSKTSQKLYTKYKKLPRPIIVDKNNQLLDGYSIVLFARDFKIKQIPVIKLENVELINQ